MLCAAVAELVSLGSVLPFLAVLAEPEQIWNDPWIQQLAPKFGWSSASSLLVPAAGIFAFTAVSAALVRLANVWLGGQLAAAIGSDLSCEAYRRTLYQPYSVHVERNSSSVINSVIGQVGSTVGAINLVLQTSTSALVAVSLLLGLICINWVVALAATFLFGGSYLVIGFFSRRALTVNGRIINDSRTEVLKSLQEGLGAVRDVILDGTQGLYLSVYRRSDRLQRKHQAKNQFLSVFPRFSLEALGLVAIAVLATLLGSHTGSAGSTLRVLGTFALGAQRLFPSMQQAYSGWSNLKSSSTDLKGVLNALDQTLPSVPKTVSEFRFRSGVVFENVGFSYGSVTAMVLNSLSFEINFAQSVGFVGSTGSGKTTTIDLLMGLLSPTQGQILVDGRDLHDPDHPERLFAWRSAIAHVPQSIYLADNSILENIAFGIPKDQIDFDRVRLSAQQAQIASFIEASPDGYESFVGERGIRLSGGQRQRLGIARALYKQAQVLILDEATSALDNDTEQSVMDAINQLDRNLTVVMIAHRLSTVAKCDRVIRLHHGRVVADGPPSEVLSKA